MTDTTPNDETDPAPETEAPAHVGMPRWVKAFAVIALLVVVVVAVAMLAGGNHSPSRHLGAGSDTGTPSQAAGGVHTPPPGGHP